MDTLYASKRTPDALQKTSDIVLPRTDDNHGLRVSGGAAVAVSRERVGTAITKRIAGIVKINPTKGCGCKNLAALMDSWGIAGCEARRPEIVNHLVGNRDVLIEALKDAGQWWQSTLAHTLPDAALRIGAHWLLDAAINDVRLEAPVTRNKTQSTFRKPIVMKLSGTQIALRDAAQASAPPTSDPFTGTPVIHFGAHLWPVRGHWEWHAERWNEVAAAINGRCIVGVVTDPSTASIDEVRALLSDRFEFFEESNTPQGENPTFRRLQEMIPSGENDVLIYCHGKGVRSHTFESESVRIWTEMMYETVLHNTERIVQKLGEGYKCFGSFRSFGDMPLKPTNRWHYSGTFFAVRAKHMRGKSVKTGYGGVEAWCGDHISAMEAWSEFCDAPGFKFGYDIKAVYPQIVDAQMQWEVDRIGGPRCEQHKRELDWFLEKLSPASRVLVIGSRNGGLEYQLQKHGHSTVSIDIAPQADNTLTTMIVGSSTDPEVQQKARDAGPYDVVFIDGDHSYAGVKADWEFAQTLHPASIAFHDIADAIKHRNEGCHVDRLWAEIKASGMKTEEKIVGAGWGGIGVVMREHQ